MNALELVRLTPLMQLASGRPEIAVALIDGPIAMPHPDLWTTNVERLGNSIPAARTQPGSVACTHGTVVPVAGVLAACRGSQAPAICPGCRSWPARRSLKKRKASAGCPAPCPPELAKAILDAVGAGARAINLSLNVLAPATRGERQLEAALNYAAARPTARKFFTGGRDREVFVLDH